MAEFVECASSLKPSLLFIDIDHSLDILSHLDELNDHHILENPNLGYRGYSNDNFLPFLGNFSSIFPVNCPKTIVNPTPASPVEEQRKGGNKRKTAAVAKTNSVTSLAAFSETRRKNRGRSNSKEVEKAKEVVIHVRARRGQATDRHSLAERVRRKKINDRMRCLQDLVPGCCKRMGMAAMLDEIINYVQSLQNQIEFLSMRLLAANSFYDFNLDMEATTQEVLPRGGDAYQAQDMERLLREGCGGCSSFQSSVPF